MNKEKQIEEMAMTPLDVLANDIYQNCPDLKENYCGDTHCVACLANALYNAGYRKQSEVELRVETTADDFKDLEIAKERGYHRKKFYCPNCDLLIKIETWDSERMFGGGSILKSNEMPKFCPECGAKMKGGAEQ